MDEPSDLQQTTEKELLPFWGQGINLHNELANKGRLE